MENVQIISHKEDLDGLSSAIILSHYARAVSQAPRTVTLVDYADMNEVIRRQAPLATELFIADLSQRDVTLSDAWSHLPKSKVHIFDHHKDSSASVQAWKDKAECYFDDGGTKCAADLTFEYVKSNKKNMIKPEMAINNDIEFLVKAAHSIDLWIRDVKEGNLLSDVLSVLGYESLYYLLDNEPWLAQERHFTLEMQDAIASSEQLRSKSKELARACHVGQAVRFLRWDVAPEFTLVPPVMIATMAQGYTSDIGEMFFEENPLCWLGMIDIERMQLSFRTNDLTIEKTGFSVRTLGNKLGGGGHPQASGAPLPVEILQGGSRELLSVMLDIFFKTPKEHA